MKKDLQISKMMLQFITLFILSLYTCTYSVSLAQPVVNTAIPEILLQPFDASICVGGSHTIENVVVMNAAGQNIYQAKPNTADLQINTANWPKGIYLIKVTSEGKFPNVYKIIKK